MFQLETPKNGHVEFLFQNTVVIEVNDRQHGQDILDEIQKELRIISHTLKYK